MVKDYFSTQSHVYKQFRPRYPARLFEFLAQQLPPNPRVWDCACGNGQASLAWSAFDAEVLASDVSFSQLAQATPGVGIHFVQASAEACPLPDASVDLVTVAQALHWFDFDRFYAEVTRVLKPDGLCAAWTYSFLSVSSQLGSDIDSVVRWFYHDVIGSYWPPERRWVDEQYRTIPFPFRETDCPEISLTVGWNLNDVLGYISSWSAVALYRRAHDADPMPRLRERLTPLWGNPDVVRQIDWTLDLRVGRRPMRYQK